MINFETVIGIEIHIELKTKTKMFSPVEINFNAESNTKANQIDLGYPGTLPQVNKKAVKYAIMLAKALNMQIDSNLRFDRKHYFYPDLPKGYQITQFYHPIGREGQIKLNNNGKEFEVNIERIHLEEDTARQHHKDNYSQLDYNRAGIPLIEIVTHPVLRSSDEACLYVDAIRKIVQTLEISEGRLEIGSLRADINISIRPLGSKSFSNKVEIKNLNSLKNIKLAIEEEITLQRAKFFANEEVLQQTKKIDEKTLKLQVLRTKTSAIDYRYFPEPNIPFIKLSKKFISSVKLKELPWEKEARYKSYNLNSIYLNSLLDDIHLANYFDSISYPDKDKLSKIFFAEVVSLANSKEMKAYHLNIDPENITKAINLLDEEVISGKSLKKLIPLLVNFKGDIKKLAKQNSLEQISDPNLISNIIKEIIKTNSELVKEYPTRQEKVLKFVLGKLMKDTGGQVNPTVANEIAIKSLDEVFK
ncbi:Asp-tRNA(Asn)/Glu-tRNA(Gln) amidotransferase subunit GatB [Mycoplasmopsis synoviae]|nr:Asp-tRNA(Asn)/Glu-tRNA(Gln) amidotransferase subunit GatB [Mycoplasmopsis synoviae]AKB10870.1 glutamyl-tRNA amidotransferase [Mycoplasmopsis synoviae ATCC 25204]